MIWDINFTAENGTGYFNFQVNVDSAISGEIASDGTITYTDISGLGDNVLKNNKTMIEKIIQTLNRHWHAIYSATILMTAVSA